MDALPEELPADYSKTIRRNCSLSRRGRLFFLALVSGNVLTIAVVCTLTGAWVVLPFAGLELAGLALAFRWVGLHDGDFERVTIFGDRVLVESGERGRVRLVEFNREWAIIVNRPTVHGCQLAIRSHGRETAIGRLMSEDQRCAWSRELEARLRVVKN